jgi:hypothetical protein
LQPVQENARWAKVIEPDSMWAYPDPHSARKKMRAAFENNRDEAKELQKIVLEKFSDEKLYKLFCKEVNESIELNNKGEKNEII